MGRALDRHRIANKYSRDLDLMMGETGSEQAATYSSLVAELAKTAGGIASAELAKKEAAEKQKKIEAAQVDLKKAQALLAKADAAEKDKSGPLHKDAQAALDRAQETLAKLTEQPLALLQSQGQNSFQSSGRPWWVYGLAGVGVLGAGLLGYKLLKK